MTRRDLQDFLNSRTPEEGAERQAITAFLSVLKHKAILEAKDIDALADIAENGKSERDRVRAAEMLATVRQRAAEAVAHATGIREEVLDAKGLRQEGPKVQVFSFEGMDLDKLKALAEGRSLAPVLPLKVVDVEPE